MATKCHDQTDDDVCARLAQATRRPESDSSLMSCSAIFTSSDVLEASLRILPEAPQDHLLEVAGNRRDDGARRLGLRANHGTQRVGGGRARKRARPGHHLVEHRAEAKMSLRASTVPPVACSGDM